MCRGPRARPSAAWPPMLVQGNERTPVDPFRDANGVSLAMQQWQCSLFNAKFDLHQVRSSLTIKPSRGADKETPADKSSTQSKCMV